MSAERKSLGRGLSSIIRAGVKSPAAAEPKKSQAAAQQQVQEQPAPVQATSGALRGLFSEILTDKISLSPYQARKDFPQEQIDALAESIASEGLIQPILVRKTKDGRYELIAGERRLKACKKLGLKRIVACVQEASDVSAAVKGLIENLQRSDLNPMEEARGLANLMTNFHLTQESVAQRLGKKRPSVANSLRLLTLPEEIQGYISTGRLTQGHAKAILSIEDKALHVPFARQIIERDMSVRAAEEAATRFKREAVSAGTKTREKAAQDAVVRDLQKRISQRLGAAVVLNHSPKRGKIIIEYIGNDDLQRILELMGVRA